MLPQDDVEELLATRLAEVGATVERPVALAGLRQDADGCEVTLRHAGGAVEHARADWVVGCDGAHSTVRQQLGLHFHGDSFEESFAVADVRVEWDRPYDQLFAFLHRGAFMAFFPMAGGRHRVAVAYRPHTAPMSAVTLEELQRALAVCGPPGARIVEMTQASRFEINQRYVERHRVGRVFVAGDAAHVHSVVGAQGMNTGIQDAVNLGWKLALVLAGRADERLLDTYVAERGPVARRLVRATRSITRVILLRSRLGTAMRRSLGSRILARPAVQQRIAAALSQLDVSYRGDGQGHHDRVPAAGDRAPDVVRDGGSRLFEQLDPSSYTLLVDGNVAMQPALLQNPEIGTVLHVADRAVRRRYGLSASRFVLIRPDGYVGLRTNELAQVTSHATDSAGRRSA
jgi:2-polyprenyl-6-methoxyphenol hydroxylase-like FAD-dependent oxidoreductase